MLDLLSRPDVFSVTIDQCMFGLQNAAGLLHRKSTRLVTSCQALISLMQNRRCDGQHSHAPVIGGNKVTAPAGHYPPALASALVQSFQDQFDFETKLAYLNAANEVMVADGNVGSAQYESSDEDELLPATTEEEKQIQVTKAVKQAVYRLHENTGHRSGRRLARALLVCGAPKEAVIAAKTLKCSICDAQRAPRPQRPASLPRTTQLGARAHIDLLVLEDAFRQRYFVVHIIDAVSRYQMASIIKDKTPNSVIQFLDPVDSYDGLSEDLGGCPRKGVHRR